MIIIFTLHGNDFYLALFQYVIWIRFPHTIQQYIQQLPILCLILDNFFRLLMLTMIELKRLNFDDGYSCFIQPFFQLSKLFSLLWKFSIQYIIYVISMRLSKVLSKLVPSGLLLHTSAAVIVLQFLKCVA